jgi:adenine deaminase
MIEQAKKAPLNIRFMLPSCVHDSSHSVWEDGFSKFNRSNHRGLDMNMSVNKARNEYEGEEVIDAEGQMIVPGFIDGHVHIESSMVTPITPPVMAISAEIHSWLNTSMIFPFLMTVSAFCLPGL